MRTTEEIEAKVNELSMQDLRLIVDASYMIDIPEVHIARKLVRELLGEEAFFHTGILTLLPHVAKRLLTIIDE